MIFVPQKEKPVLTRGLSKVSVKSDDDEQQVAQVQAAEERASGTLKWAVIWQYLKSVDSWCIVLTAITALLITQASATTADYWLSYW